MAPESLQRTIWELVRRQHGVVSRPQLLGLGLSEEAVRHRLVSGRLHHLYPGVYAVGRPEASRKARFAAAVLCCGARAALSHASAAELWGVRPPSSSWPHISVPLGRAPDPRRGIHLHRRKSLEKQTTLRAGIVVTTVPLTLTDLATHLTQPQLERAINEADRLDLMDPEALRAAIERSPRRPGLATLRRLLDSRTFTLTDSELERAFLPLARSAGLPSPVTGARVNGFKVDFFWPDLGLVVETDGLRYHRTPAQQAADGRRDQIHAIAGMTPVRFTYAQVRYEPERVKETLSAVAQRLSRPEL